MWGIRKLNISAQKQPSEFKKHLSQLKIIGPDGREIKKKKHKRQALREFVGSLSSSKRRMSLLNLSPALKEPKLKGEKISSADQSKVKLEYSILAPKSNDIDEILDTVYEDFNTSKKELLTSNVLKGSYKTREEKLYIKFWIGKINEYFEAHGFNGRYVSPADIYVIDENKLEDFLGHKGAVYKVKENVVLLPRPKDADYSQGFMDYLVHEILHAKSCQSYEIYEQRGEVGIVNKRDGIVNLDIINGKYLNEWLDEAVIDWTTIDIMQSNGFKVNPTSYDKEIFNLLSILFDYSVNNPINKNNSDKMNEIHEIFESLQQVAFNGDDLQKTLSKKASMGALLKEINKCNDSNYLSSKVTKLWNTAIKNSFPNLRVTKENLSKDWLNFYFVTLLEQLYPDVKFTYDVKTEIINDLAKAYQRPA